MIAISYRREDSLPIAGRLYDRLQSEFGRTNVFMDFDSIPYGVDFRQHIQDMLDKSKVLLAVIGPEWLGRGKQKKRRIDDPTDFVRLEIAYAFERKIPVIPVLIGNTSMPKAENLPKEISDLAFRNAVTLDIGLDFHHHTDRLVRGINRILIESARAAAPPMRPLVKSGPATTPQTKAPDPRSIQTPPSPPKSDPVLFRESERLGVGPAVPRGLPSKTPSRIPTESASVPARPPPQATDKSTASRDRAPKRPRNVLRVTAGITIVLAGVVLIYNWNHHRSTTPQIPTTDRTTSSSEQNRTVSAAPAHPPDARDVEKQQLARAKFEEARQAYEQNDFAAAKVLADQADMITPNQPYVLNLIGQILDASQQPNAAETFFRKALQADPGFQDAQANLKSLLAEKSTTSTPGSGLAESATPAPLPQSVHTTANDRLAARIKCEQAEQALRKHDLTTARSILTDAASLDPLESSIYDLRGQILREEKNYTAAEAEFRAALRIDPDFKDARSNLISLLAEQGRSEPDAGQSPRETEGRIGVSEIEDFIRHFVSANQSQDPDAIALTYSDNVDYFGARRDQAYIKEDVKKYIQRWPLRQDLIEGDIQIQEEDPEDYAATFKLNFYAEDQNRQWTRGQFAVQLGVNVASGTPKISSIKEHVLQQQKGKNKAKEPIKSKVTPIQILQAERPSYPPEAEQRGETGSGRFNIEFDEHGNATAVTIVQSTGSKILDAHTVSALKDWHAVAGRPGNIIVPITYTKPRTSQSPPPRQKTAQGIKKR